MFGKDILLVINPEASKGRGRKKAKAIDSYFTKHNRSSVIRYTEGKGHAESIAFNGAIEGYRTIVAVGGDGTVNGVLNGIMRSGYADRVKMGIIPVGRGNDFAWVCGIPKNTRKASDIVLWGKGKKTDVGICYGEEHQNGMYFFNGAGFGFESMVNFKAMEYKRLNGMPSYVAAFFYILNHPPLGYNLRLVIDGEERVLSTQQISVANGKRMGSAFKMTPKASIEDGKLDVMFTNKCFLGIHLFPMVIKFLKGDHVNDGKGFSYLNATDVRVIDQKAEMPIHLDGEVFSKSAKTAHIKILPGAITLLR